MARHDHSTLQGSYLNELRKQRMLVQIYLTSGIRLTGTIESFDQYVLMLRHGSDTHLIYKHMIASIMPATKAVPAAAATTVKQAVKPTDPSAVKVVTRKAPRRTIVPEY